MRHIRAALLTGLLALAGTAPLRAQSGDGSTAGAVFAIPAGTRAAALGGAYVAGLDVDVLFYNPAGAAWLPLTATAAVQRHVEDMTYASLAAALRIGRARLGAAVEYLDFGEVQEIEPDPAFGGQRGRATGESVHAGEGVMRLLLALPVGDRLAVGASVGVFYTMLAESGRPGSVFDAGLQYRLSSDLTFGAALRNAGRDLSGAGLADGPLPTELRVGASRAALRLPVDGVLLGVSADLVANLVTDKLFPAGGLELGLPVAGQAVAAVRIGYDGAAGASAQGRWRLGAGLVLDRLALDYVVQPTDVLGTAHRFGIRWTQRAR